MMNDEFLHHSGPFSLSFKKHFVCAITGTPVCT